VPQGVIGPLAIYITKDAQPLNGNVVDRQTRPVVGLAGFALCFVYNNAINISAIPFTMCSDQVWWT
jgi:hypothetical protein